MHHYPEPPRPPAGRRRPAPRPRPGSRRGDGRGIGRVTAGLFISGFVAVLLLAAPLFSGPGGLLTVFTLDTSATGDAPTGDAPTAADSPLQMGVDGVPDASGLSVEPTSPATAEATGSAVPVPTLAHTGAHRRLGRPGSRCPGGGGRGGRRLGRRRRSRPRTVPMQE